MMATMTKAEVIAYLFHNDGQRFETTDRVPSLTLDDACHSFGCVMSYENRGMTDQKVRYVFSDESVITAVGDGWDIGYLDCFCWRGGGHTERCDNERNKAHREMIAETMEACEDYHE